jgi:hypothetical protein
VPLDYLVYNGHNPHVILYSFAGGDSGFFQIPTFSWKGKIPKKESSTTTFITAKEVTITSDLEKSELTRLISERDGLGLSRDTRTVLWYLLCPKSNFNRMVAMKHWRHFN